MKALLILAAALLVFPQNAHAYLDPGSGSMIVQLLIAGIAGAGVALKFFWRRIADSFRRPGAKN